MHPAPAAAEIAEAFLAEIRALIEAIGLVGNFARRSEAVVETGGIDKRFDRRSGLAQRLRGAVKAAQAAVEPALHSEDAPGLRVLREEGARDFGNRAQAIAARRLLRRDHIADIERTGCAEQRIGLATGQADLGRRAPFGHHAHAPIFVIDRKIGGTKLADQVAIVGVQGGDRAGEPAIALIAQQLRPQRIARRVLQFQIERCPNPETARINAVGSVFRILAELVDQLAAHLFEEIARIRRAFLALLDQTEILRLGRVCGSGGDEIIGHHLVEHEIAPFDRHVAKPFAPIPFRRLGQDREKRHFVQIEIADILVEIGARGGLDAETATAERDFVEIQFENFPLAQRILDPAGEDHLLQLARDRIFIAEQDVLGDLLGDGGAAHGAFARSHLAGVIEHGIGRAAQIDAAMAEERLVLRRQIGLDQLGREIDILQLHAPFAGIGVDDLAIAAAHHGRQRRFVFEQRFDIRQVARQQRPGGEQARDRETDKDAAISEPAPLAPIGREPCESSTDVSADTVAIIV